MDEDSRDLINNIHFGIAKDGLSAANDIDKAANDLKRLGEVYNYDPVIGKYVIKVGNEVKYADSISSGGIGRNSNIQVTDVGGNAIIDSLGSNTSNTTFRSGGNSSNNGSNSVGNSFIPPGSTPITNPDSPIRWEPNEDGDKCEAVVRPRGYQSATPSFRTAEECQDYIDPQKYSCAGQGQCYPDINGKFNSKKACEDAVFIKRPFAGGQCVKPYRIKLSYVAIKYQCSTTTRDIDYGTQIWNGPISLRGPLGKSGQPNQDPFIAKHFAETDPRHCTFEWWNGVGFTYNANSPGDPINIQNATLYAPYLRQLTSFEVYRADGTSAEDDEAECGSLPFECP